MNFNNNNPNFPPFPPSLSPQDSQLESLMKLFSPQGNTTAPEAQNDERAKNLANFKAFMNQMFLNNYRNCLLMPPQMNPFFCQPPSNLLSMVSPPVPGPMAGSADPLAAMRRGGPMNDMMMQALAKFNMLNMMNPYSLYSMTNPLLGSMMMESFFKNYLKETLNQGQQEALNAGNYTIVNLDTVPSNSENCLCGGKKSNEELPSFQCANESCKRKFHLRCLKYTQSELECPICFLRKMDPLHQVIKVLVQPFHLTASPSFVFKRKILLDFDSIKQIFESEDVFLEFRSVRLEEGYKFETSWIDYGTLSLNETMILELTPLQSNSCLKKRKDEKVSIKQFLRPDQNELKITVKASQNEDEARNLRIDKTAEFLVGVYLIKKVANNDLVKALLEGNRVSEDQSRTFLQSYFSKELSNHSDDLFLDQMRVNLLDPIDFQAIRTPSRGRFCKHFNCFSLETFVSITRDSLPRKWRCPICKKPCYEFLIDGYLLKIIEEAKSQGKVLRELIIFDDGKVEPVEEQSTKDESKSEKGDESLEDKKKEALRNRERFSLVIEEKGDLIPDGLSENTKSTNFYEEKSLKIESNNTNNNNGSSDHPRKRKFKDISRESEKKGPGTGGYQLRSKKVCLNNNNNNINNE